MIGQEDGTPPPGAEVVDQSSHLTQRDALVIDAFEQELLGFQSSVREVRQGLGAISSRSGFVEANQAVSLASRLYQAVTEYTNPYPDQGKLASRKLVVSNAEEQFQGVVEELELMSSECARVCVLAVDALLSGEFSSQAKLQAKAILSTHLYYVGAYGFLTKPDAEKVAAARVRLDKLTEGNLKNPPRKPSIEYAHLTFQEKTDIFLSELKEKLSNEKV